MSTRAGFGGLLDSVLAILSGVGSATTERLCQHPSPDFMSPPAVMHGTPGHDRASPDDRPH